MNPPPRHLHPAPDPEHTTLRKNRGCGDLLLVALLLLAALIGIPIIWLWLTN